MTPFPSSNSIKLRQRTTLAENSSHPEETTILLSEKLDQLFEAGYEQDDIYGIVIPLLIQGKVRINLEGRSERLELEDEDQRLHRTTAVQVFDDYIAGRPA